jgi:hypothetical protein
MIGFIGTSVIISLNYNLYIAIADLHNLQFTFAQALGFSVSTIRLLATDLNTQTITSNHYEVCLSSLTLYFSVLICTQLIFTIHYGYATFLFLYYQLLLAQSQSQKSQSYFTTRGLPPISSSWRQAP